MKQCSSCKITKHLHEFSRDRARQDGFAVHCKECRRKIAHKSYRNNTKAKCQARSKLRHELHVSRINKIKQATGCKYCPENDPCCLDFHHRDPKSKSFTIALRTKRKWEIIVEEIQKCDIICANCHRKHHAGRFE